MCILILTSISWDAIHALHWEWTLMKLNQLTIKNATFQKLPALFKNSKLLQSQEVVIHTICFPWPGCSGGACSTVPTMYIIQTVRHLPSLKSKLLQLSISSKHVNSKNLNKKQNKTEQTKKCINPLAFISSVEKSEWGGGEGALGGSGGGARGHRERLRERNRKRERERGGGGLGDREREGGVLCQSDVSKCKCFWIFDWGLSLSVNPQQITCETSVYSCHSTNF